MINVLIAGVGGQGSVLASKVLAQAAASRGWQVRTAETIGMAQRGGSVVGHVRMGNEGESVFSPLVSEGCADVIIALEPGEGARALPYLRKGGIVVSATTPQPAITASLAGDTYDGRDALACMKEAAGRFVAVDDAALCNRVGSRKVLNVVMLAGAVRASLQSVAEGEPAGLADAISIDQLEDALRASVKPRFVDMNIAAVAETAC